MAVETPAPPQSHPASEEETGRRRRSAAALLLPLALVLVAGGLRFYRLGYPERIYFDETYYAEQGREVAAQGTESGFVVHPPLGKVLIASGISAFGFTPFGWRFAAAAAGTLLVLLTYLAGLRLFRRRGVAALAAFLLAVDGLAFTMSRIAMLDVFLAMFVVLGVWLLLVDRDQQWEAARAESEESTVVLPRRSHWPRWLAGLAFGLALATKWSALLALAGAVVFTLVSEAAYRRRVTGSAWTGYGRAVASAAASLVLVPLLVYVAAYGGWFANFESTRKGEELCGEGECGLSLPTIAGAWVDEQVAIADFHLPGEWSEGSSELEVSHPYRSSAVTWPLLVRPVAYYYESCDQEKLAAGECVTEQSNVEEILGIGNPAVWWLALPAYLAAGWYAVVRRDWRAATVLGFALVQYLPWLLVPRPSFLFYLTPVVPFVALTLAYVAARLARLRGFVWVPGFVGLAAAASFVFFYPVWTGLEISRGAWRLRMLFDSWI